MDEDVEKWREKAVQYSSIDPMMNHFNVPLGFSSDFVDKFKIKALPRFILIDSLGNIFNANSFKPSSKRAANYLKRLN